MQYNERKRQQRETIKAECEKRGINIEQCGAVDSRTQMQIAQVAGAAVQRAMRRNG